MNDAMDKYVPPQSSPCRRQRYLYFRGQRGCAQLSKALESIKLAPLLTAIALMYVQEDLLRRWNAIGD